MCILHSCFSCYLCKASFQYILEFNNIQTQTFTEDNYFTDVGTKM